MIHHIGVSTGHDVGIAVVTNGSSLSLTTTDINDACRTLAVLIGRYGARHTVTVGPARSRHSSMKFDRMIGAASGAGAAVLQLGSIWSLSEDDVAAAVAFHKDLSPVENWACAYALKRRNGGFPDAPAPPRSLLGS